MTSLMEVLFSEGTFGDTGPCIPPIRFFRCLCLFLSTYHHTYMQPLIYFEALPLSWSLAADWQIDLFHPVCSIKSGPMYVVLNILRMQNQSKRGGCENYFQARMRGSPRRQRLYGRTLARLPIFAHLVWAKYVVPVNNSHKFDLCFRIRMGLHAE